jgi:hypothetical protein
MTSAISWPANSRISQPRRAPSRSFHFPGQGSGVRRIIRATRTGAKSGTKLLLSVSDHLGQADVMLDFDNGDEARLRDLVEQQLALYHKHFAGNPTPR